MRNIITIASREWRSSFYTPLAYVLISGFLLLSGFFFFSFLQQFNVVLARTQMIRDSSPSLNEWIVIPFYNTLQIVLIFLIPLLTMRSIAEERKAGTFELLATSPLTSGEIVLGKFLGVAVVITVMLLLSLSFPLVLVVFADPEVAPILIGFLGLLLFALALAAIGVAVSACARSQTVAGVLSLVILLVYYIIDAPAERFSEFSRQFLYYLAPARHAEALTKGLLTASDLVYFLSVIALGLFIANRILDAESWR